MCVIKRFTDRAILLHCTEEHREAPPSASQSHPSKYEESHRLLYFVTLWSYGDRWRCGLLPPNVNRLSTAATYRSAVDYVN